MSKAIVVLILFGILLFAGCTSQAGTSPPTSQAAPQAQQPQQAPAPKQTYSCPDGTVVTDLANCPKVSPPAPTKTYTCPDGSIVTDLTACPKAPSVPTQTYSCPDGSIVTDLSACPSQQTNQKLSLTLKIVTPSDTNQYIHYPVITIANDGNADATDLVIDAELYKGSKLVTSQSGVYLMAGSKSIDSVGAGQTVKGYLGLMWYSGNTDISDGVYTLKVSVRKGADAIVISSDSASVSIGS